MSQATESPPRDAADLPPAAGGTRRRIELDHLAVPVVLLAIWWILAAALPSYVASPAAAVTALVRGTGEGWLSTHGLATLSALAYGYGLAVVVGVAAGLAVGSSRFAYDVLQPLIYAIYTLPKVTLFPIFLFAFGISTAAQAWFGMFFGVFPVLIFTAAGVREVAPVLRRVARSFRLGPVTTFRSVVLPAALPAVVTGLRMGFGLTFLGVVISEMFASQAGLGFLLIESVRLQDMPRLYGIVLLLSLFAFAVNGLYLWWERSIRHETPRASAGVTGASAG